jgi:F-type H+-transporting ATPase subunit delta
MKYSEKKIALALYESVKGKDKKEIKKIISEFLRVLKENNCLHKTESIVIEFSKIWNKEEEIVEASVESATLLGKKSLKELNDYIKKITKAERVDIANTENKNIIGGALIKYGDKILDASLKTKIECLKEEIKK